MEEKENKLPVQVVQVATETQEFFSVNGEVMSLNQYLTWIGNLMLEVKKVVG
jgi:hypothetical protein